MNDFSKKEKMINKREKKEIKMDLVERMVEKNAAIIIRIDKSMEFALVVKMSLIIIN
jgi:hypothetical protein